MARRRLSVDEAFIALMIAAMEANGHAAPAEAARAQRIITSMARFRGRPATVGRLIARMKRMAGDRAPEEVVAAACGAIPGRLRGPALAVAADLVIVDGRLDAPERKFLSSVATHLGQTRRQARTILDVVRLKNRA